MNMHPRIRLSIFFLVLAWFSTTAWTQEVTVTQADPSEAEQGTIALEVRITGTGFEPGANVKYLRAGTNRGGGISVNSVNYVSDTELVTNVDVEIDAWVGDYDIEVRVSGGRRGKGTTRFAVTEKIHEDGQNYPMDCVLLDDAEDTLLSDGMGAYIDSLDKVGCGTGGTVDGGALHGTPSLWTFNKGPVKKAVRKFDLALDPCIEDYGCNLLPTEFFEAVADADEMEDGVIGISRYPEQGHLTQLIPGQTYPMSLRVQVVGYRDRYVVQLMGREIPEEYHQGIFCDLANPADAISEDVDLYVWPDNDGDSLPDGYTITTGTLNTDTTPPTLAVPGSRLATICSTDGPLKCGGPGGDGDMCNMLGRVEFQMTWHAVMQQ